MTSASVAILFDEPQDVVIRQDGTESRFEMMSTTSVETIMRALKELGVLDVSLVTTAELFDLVSRRTRPPFSLAINLSSGLVNRWRYVQGPMALELLRTPYSGSSLFAILLCRDKHRCKAVCCDAVSVPESVCVTDERLHLLDEIRKEMFPAVVKPNQEGGSVGLKGNVIVENRNLAKHRVVALLKDYPEGVLIERFIPGAEITSVVIGNGPTRKIIPLALANRDSSSLPSTFIRTQQEKAEAFKTGDRTWFNVRDTHGEDIRQSVITASEGIASALDLRDLARLDFRVNPDGRVFFIEANAQPTFVPGNTSLYRCSELFFDDILGVEKAYIRAALERVGFSHSDAAE